jgi:hypothetical protein
LVQQHPLDSLCVSFVYFIFTPYKILIFKIKAIGSVVRSENRTPWKPLPIVINDKQQ